MRTDSLSLEKCVMCPRKCGADRIHGVGFCGAGAEVEVSKIMLHYWEEPPISGFASPEEKEKGVGRGSGAVFFTHCSLGCVYCQNSKISRTRSCGKKYTSGELALEFLKLEKNGAYNINLVTPTHYLAQLIESVALARGMGLTLPVVWNTGGYELPEVIHTLRGTADVFLTDFKYSSRELALRLSRAKDYADFAVRSLKEMYDCVGECAFDSAGMMTRGVIVRVLVLPSHRDDAIQVLRMIAEAVPVEKIRLSLMAQYTPEFLPDSGDFNDIRRKITTYEYEKVRDEAVRLGFDGYMQDRSAATKKFTPDF